MTSHRPGRVVQTSGHGDAAWARLLRPDGRRPKSTERRAPERRKRIPGFHSDATPC